MPFLLSTRWLWLTLAVSVSGLLTLALWHGLSAYAAPASACASVCYVNALTGDDANAGDTPLTAKRTVSAAVSSVAPGGLVSVAAGLYVETITLTQPITLVGAGAGADPTQHTILSGFGVAGRAPGIALAYAASDITLQGLRIQNHDNGGICGAGQNNRLTLQALQVYTSTAGVGCVGGIHLMGPLNDLTVDNVEVRYSSLRGLVVWFGAKQRVRITNSLFANNGGWGLSLHDGSASGVVITHTVIQDNINGLMLTGLTGGHGPNYIADNTLLNNGQRGLELRQPNGTGALEGDGAVVVERNLVALTQPITAQFPLETRDLAGLAVIRNNVITPNVDMPRGVVVRLNTVSGYQQVNPASSSDGYGMVIEGLAMQVVSNTLTHNDIGLQFQQGHGPYAPGVNLNGDDTDRADDFYGNGNAPQVSGWAHGNTLADNGLGVRVTVSGTAASTLTLTQNIIERAPLAGVVITGLAPLTATLGGQPDLANRFREVPLAVQVNAPPTATLSAFWNDWLADPNTVDAVEARLHHQVDDPTLAYLPFYTFTLAAPTHAAGVAVITPAVSGLFTPTGQAIHVLAPPLTTTALVAEASGAASLTLVAPDPLTLTVTATVGLSVNHAFTREAVIAFAGLRTADLGVALLGAPASLTDTDPLTWTTQVYNLGPSRAMAQVTSSLLGAFTDLNWQCVGVACPASTGTGDLSTTVTVPAQSALTLTMQATTTAPGLLTHTISVVGPTDFVETNPDDNQATFTATVAARQADVQVTAQASAFSATLPAWLTFTAVISNASVWPLTSATLTGALAGPAVPLTWTCAPDCLPAMGVGALPPFSLTLAAQAALTLTLVVSPTAPGEVSFTVQAAAPAPFVDPEPANNQASASALMSPAAPTVFTVWLPVVARTLAAPDLVVQAVTVTARALTVTVQNVGNLPVTSGFWVDAYLAPYAIPNAVNQLWPGYAPQGVAWGVPGSVTLAPGQSLTLTLRDAYYSNTYSLFVNPLPAGALVYVQVDSFNPATTYGLVLETHEITSKPYNNIAGPFAVP